MQQLPVNDFSPRPPDAQPSRRSRRSRLKKAGRTADEVVATNVTKDLDPIWGKGFMPPNMFVTIVYNTLP